MGLAYSTGGNQSTTTFSNESESSGHKKDPPQFVHSNKNVVKLVPKSKIDYNLTYTANNFITVVRAFNEFLLKPSYVFDSIRVRNRCFFFFFEITLAKISRTKEIVLLILDFFLL